MMDEVKTEVSALLHSAPCSVPCSIHPSQSITLFIQGLKLFFTIPTNIPLYFTFALYLHRVYTNTDIILEIILGKKFYKLDSDKTIRKCLFSLSVLPVNFISMMS
jgi:hypothetical protein